MNPFEIEQKICSDFIRNYAYVGVSAEMCATRPATTSITSYMFRALQLLGKRGSEKYPKWNGTQQKKVTPSTPGLQDVLYLQDGIPRLEYVVDNHGEHPRTLGPSISFCFANCHKPHPRFSRRAAMQIKSSTVDAFMVIVV